MYITNEIKLKKIEKKKKKYYEKSKLDFFN